MVFIFLTFPLLEGMAAYARLILAPAEGPL